MMVGVMVLASGLSDTDRRIVFLCAVVMVAGVTIFVVSHLLRWHNMIAWRREVRGAQSNETTAFEANVRTFLDELKIKPGEDHEEDRVIIGEGVLPGEQSTAAEALRVIMDHLNRERASHKG